MRIILFLVALMLAPAAQAQTLADLAWLKGCWQTPAPREAESGAQITEVWVAPPGPAMFGYSFTEGEGEIQSWEQMRIAMIDGWPSLIAMPNGGPPVRFRMREQDVLTPGLAQFDNPEHDYPQTIEYRRQGNQLTATISGANGVNPYVFSYRRIRCPASLRP